MSSIPVARLNHAVLYVRDLDRAVEFHASVFGEVVAGWQLPLSCGRRATTTTTT
jgi:predicted enzyme related to lactoylglutathione lyase